MSSLTSRYRAVCNIALCSGADGDISTVLQRILSAAEDALPDLSLELLLANGKGHTLLRSPNSKHPPTKVAPRTASRILAFTEPQPAVLTRNGSRNKCMVIPLDHELSGAIVCGGSSLSDEETEFLRLVGSYISLHLRCGGSGFLQPPVKKRIESVSAIYEISQAVHNVSVGDLLKLVTRTAASVMDAEVCSLMLKDPSKDELVIRASHGLSREIIEETRVKFGEGVAGRVAATGEPMLIHNINEDPRFQGIAVKPMPGIASSICVPLRDEEGHVQGVLSARRRSPSSPFTQPDVELFSVFASQAALAISNAHLYGSLKDRVQELSALYKASRKLSEAYSLADTAKALVQVAVDMMGGGSAMLILSDENGQVKIPASVGIGKDLIGSVRRLISDEAIAWARRLREPRQLMVDNESRWPAAIRPMAEICRGTLNSITLLPMIAEDTVTGLLVLGDEAKKFPEQRRLRMVSIAASQAATVIKNVSAHEEQIEQKALELTALCQLSERISTAGNLREALDSILDIVRETVRYDEAFIATVDYETNMMTVQVCRGLPCAEFEGSEFGLESDALTSWAIRERKALLSPDISKDPRFGQPIVRAGTVRSLMAIPLVVHDEVVGLLTVHGYVPNLYTEDNVRVLSVIASQAAALYKELQALSALANYTDNILRSIAAGVLTLDREGRVLTWNKAAEDIIDIPAEQAVGRHFSELVDSMGIEQADKERILDAINRVVETGEKYLGYKQEYHPIDKENLCVNMNISQLHDDAGEMLGLVIIFEDVTKEVQLENEMRAISELAAVGQLAASIAHELRNPLSSIKGAAQYLKNEYSDHTSVCEFLDIIIEEVNILNRITTEFLDFARPLKLHLKDVDINDVVFRTVQFMHLEIAKNNTEVEQRLAYDIPRIQADDKQLEQVLRNIVLNALHAMADQEGKLVISSCSDGDGVRLTITDTGMGIPDEVLSQIFVPFFTTKTKGTGLGLSIVRKIVDNHGGKITVDSKPGQGTSFEIFLPLTGGAAKTSTVHADDIQERGEADFLRRGRRIT